MKIISKNNVNEIKNLTKSQHHPIIDEIVGNYKDYKLIFVSDVANSFITTYEKSYSLILGNKNKILTMDFNNNNMLLDYNAVKIEGKKAFIKLQHKEKADKIQTIYLFDYLFQNNFIKSISEYIFNPSLPDGLFEKNGKLYFNTFGGFVDIDKDIVSNDITNKPFLDFLDLLIYGRDNKQKTQSKENEREYLLKEIAWKIQNPSKKTDVFTIFTGDQGIGKTTVFDSLKSLLKNPNQAKSLTDIILTGFNHMIEKSLFVLIEEVSSIYKYQINNVAFIMATTNEKVSMNIDSEDRRVFVVSCAKSYKEDEKYYKEFYKKFYNWLKEERGNQILLKYLRGMKLGDFHPSFDKIKIQAQNELAVNSLCPIKSFLLDYLNGNFGEYKNISRDSFFEMFQEKVKNYNVTKNVFISIIGEVLNFEKLFGKDYKTNMKCSTSDGKRHSFNFAKYKDKLKQEFANSTKLDYNLLFNKL